MRSLLLSLPLLTAAGALTLAPGPARAQQLNRPSYYTPSNYGNGPSRPSYFTPSNMGNSPARTSYGMPVPGQSNPNASAAPSAATPVPVGQLSSFANPSAVSGPVAPPAGTPTVESPAAPPAGTPAPGYYPVPTGEVPPGNPATAPPGTPGAEGLAPPLTASALGTYAVPAAGFSSVPSYGLSAATRPSYYEGYFGRPSPAPGYGPAHAVPPYESSFYAPLRRVYPSPGY